jgi:hypothetical protein
MSDNDLNDSDRRRATRIDSTLSLHYLRISPLEVRKDPYDTRFELPRYFLLAGELAQVDHVQRTQLSQLSEESPLVASAIQAINLKLDLLSKALQDSMARLLSPVPQRVSLSESGISFHAQEALTPGTHLHLSISNPVRGYHVAATGRVVYCEDEDLEGFRTGVMFVTVHPEDRAIMVRDILRRQKEIEVVEAFANPDI